MAKTNFDNGNPPTTRGTIVTAEFLNALQRHRHDGADSDGSCPLNYAVATGTANAIAIALTPALAGHVAGMLITFKATATNTGAVTLAVNSLPAIGLKNSLGGALIAGDIQAGQILVVAYDGANYNLIATSSANTLQGKQWVNVVSSSVSVNTNAQTSVNLRGGAGHRHYRFSVYSGTALVVHGYSTLANFPFAYIERSTAIDVLTMVNNNTGVTMTFNYSVDIWE